MGREYRELITITAIMTLEQVNHNESNLNPPALASLYTLVGFFAASMVQYIPGSAKMLLI